MRVILTTIHPYPSPQAVPLGTAFLLAGLGQTTLDVELADFFAGEDAAACAAQLAGRTPTAVGFSLYVWNRTLCGDIARCVRQALPGVLLFAGGPEATADPGRLLEEGVFDLLVVGEGEQPFAELCRRLAAGSDLNGIPGVLMPGQGTAVPAQLPADLDSIPSPWLGGVLDCSGYSGILWQLSRGCSFACDFCFDSRGNSGVRRFSLARIEAELRHFAAKGVSQVFVLDSTFNQDKQRAKAILRLIRAIAPHTHFHFEVRSELLDREMAGLFAAISCSLQIGLQSADAAVLKGVGRTFRPEDFAGRVALLNESGAVFGFDLMYGLPGDTLAGFRRSLDYALALYPNHLDIFPLAVLPGTALAGRSRELGLQHLATPPYTLIASPDFPEADMARARLLALACDVFYTRGRAVAWFNGMLDALGEKPATFLERFGAWLETQAGSTICEADLDDRRIWQMQREYITSRCKPPRHRRILPVLLDLIDYHHAYAQAVLLPPAPTAGRRARRPGEEPLKLSASAQLASFHYDILELLDAGAPDIRRLAARLRPTGSWAVIYPSPHGVCTESVAEPFFRLLERLDGRTPAGRCAAELGIPVADARDFLAFAVAEGIVVRGDCGEVIDG